MIWLWMKTSESVVESGILPSLAVAPVDKWISLNPSEHSTILPPCCARPAGLTSNIILDQRFDKSALTP